MVLLHPWLFAAGAAAVSLPVAVHFLTRPRPVVMPLSTIRFVMEAVQQKRARYRLRDWVILILRAGAVALLAWAFARPLMGAKPLINIADNGRAIRVVIVDQSQSMAATSRGTSAFQRARTAAAKYLGYQPGLRADLILGAARAHPTFETASVNLSALRDDLAAANPQPQQFSVQDALNTAGDILAKSSAATDARRELVIVSDFQRTNWASADFSAIPKETLIQFESVAAKETPENLGILSVSSEGRVEQFHTIRVNVEVGNYSPSPREVRVDVKLGDSVYPLNGTCPPRIKTILSGEIELKSAGWLTGEARLINVNDALAADNVRYFTMNVQTAPVYALITRESATPSATSSHYLERALAPITAKDNRSEEKVVRIHPSRLDRNSLAGASLIVLDHPGKLSRGAADLITDMLRHGRGVFYVVAESADAENLRMIENAAGADLKMPVNFSAARGQGDVFISEWRKDQPPFNALGDELRKMIAPLRFANTLTSQRNAAGLADDILATYSDRSAALVITPCAAGTLAVLNADLTQSDLAGSALFVPMVDEIAARLIAQHSIDRAPPSGEPAAMFLPPDASPVAGLQVTSDKYSVTDPGKLSEDASSVVWRLSAAGPPGVYAIKRGAATVFAMATAIPADESDLQAIDPDVLKTRLAAGRRTAVSTMENDNSPKDTAWSWSLVACAACMLAELALLKFFKS